MDLYIRGGKATSRYQIFRHIKYWDKRNKLSWNALGSKRDVVKISTWSKFRVNQVWHSEIQLYFSYFMAVSLIGGENHRPHWHNLWHKVVSKHLAISRIRTHNFSGDSHWLHKSNYHMIMTTPLCIIVLYQVVPKLRKICIIKNINAFCIMISIKSTTAKYIIMITVADNFWKRVEMWKKIINQSFYNSTQHQLEPKNQWLHITMVCWNYQFNIAKFRIL
jgi:hypothetical protein